MKLLFGAIILGVILASISSAQQPSVQDPQGRPRQTKPSQKPASESAEKPEQPVQTEPPDEAMRRALNRLSTQIGLLAEELVKLRAETERGSAILELLLNEDRLTKLDEKIQQANDRKAGLEARDQELQRRLRNVQAEAALRGGLRREEAEAAVRSELQRALEDTRAQHASNQQRISELSESSARLRARVEALRKIVDQTDDKTDKDK